MSDKRIKQLQIVLKNPLLIKKKENLLYLTGRSFMQGYLLVKPAKYPHLTSPYFKGRKKSVPPLNLRGGQGVIFLGDGLEKVEGIKFDRLKNIALYLGKAHRLDLEDEFTFREYDYIKRKAKSAKRKVKLRHVKSPVDFQRAIKDENEIRLVKTSMQIVEKVFELLKKKLVRRSLGEGGWTEIKLARFIRSSGLKLGADDVSFPPIVAAGPNAAVPHHVPSSKRLKAGESIIIDFGFKHKNYCSDFTRTVFLKKISKRLEIAYNQVERAYYESMASCNHPSLTLPLKGRESKPFLPLEGGGRVGVKAGDVYQTAVDVLAEKHLDKYFIHSLGHGTGLEIHELPNLSPGSKEILQDGMVFSIEPGVYIPRLGGIRIEDLVYLDGGKVKRFINVPTKLINNII